MSDDAAPRPETAGVRPLVIVSRSLTREVLADGRITSSSQKFERGFVLGCSARTPVTVVNVSKRGDGGREGRIGDIRFLSTTYAGLIPTLIRVAPRDAAVLTTGYGPITMIALAVSRLLGKRVFAFIYDSHLNDLNGRSLAGRLAIHAYFGIGFLLAHLMNGWIVLNDAFVRAGRLPSPPCLKVRVGVDPALRPSPPRPATASDRPVFVWSGTLNADNGTQVLIDAAGKMGARAFELHVYGYGPMTHLVQEAAARDPRIRFHGRVDNAEVVAAQRRADALVHLRDPRSAGSDHAYPSKLIEYLCSDRPVISNPIPVISDVQDLLIPLDAYDAEALASTLSAIVDRRLALPRQTGAAAVVVARQNWNTVSAEVLDFVSAPR
ncbi:MAG TPA: glycosyltransferase [Brevundimonas sp.]|jgi:glycosyltransferase involved in cell wall biosynthesis|uniref:glycosyltransferase n=1 Tax=Brevundimonas sp. TaxID=1871086 RepID=UPI002DE3BC3E|nr:glycosyltransferase [Brevundimonas sp.]